jgi:beta-phosphoglucomutase-like phosphatase (HAD superfamily)
LDIIITAEDVTKGKPDPEIYLLAAKKLKLLPKDCLVLEDTVNGVKSALAAGMSVVSIATPFTRAGILSSGVIEKKWIVQKPEKVAMVVRSRIEAHNFMSSR